MPLTRVSMASSPKLSCSPRYRLYASSMNSTPPRALWITLLLSGGSVAGVAAYQIRPAHLHQLPAAPVRQWLSGTALPSRAMVILAGARVAGKDHYASRAWPWAALPPGGAVTCRLSARPKTYSFDGGKPYQAVQLLPHSLGGTVRSGVGRRSARAGRGRR